jgi:uracil-DNA glycosylase
MTEREDSPKLLSDHAARAARHAQLRGDHIAPLSAFVEELRTTAGRDASIPDFDPWDGGVRAQVLFLLEAQGSKAIGLGLRFPKQPR